MKIGNEEYLIKPLSKRTLDIEMVILMFMVYVTVYLWVFEYISWPIFYIVFHFFYMRFFMGNHERFHSIKSKNWPRLFEIFSEYFALAVTPWDEPYDSIRTKHFIHHATHVRGKKPTQEILQNPHSIYEAGGFWRSLFFCLFFEEAQLIIDIFNKNITKSRWIRLMIYLPLQILFIYNFGWGKYLGVFIAVRLLSSGGWLFFSWFSHTVSYKFGYIKQLKHGKLILFLMGVLNGKYVRDGFFRHASHHAWPSVPPDKLYLLDEAVLRNPDSMPEMIPSTDKIAVN